jgi:hypothetical protein
MMDNKFKIVCCKCGSESRWWYIENDYTLSLKCNNEDCGNQKNYEED